MTTTTQPLEHPPGPIGDPTSLSGSALPELAALLIHDLRNPLFIVLAIAQELRSGGDSHDEVRQEALDDLLYSAETLKRMLADLHDLLRGTLQPRPVPTEVGPWLEELVRLPASHAAAAGITLRLEVQDPLPPVSLDPLLSRRVVEDLLDLCLKYSPDEAEIRVRAEAGEEGGLKLSISDQGRSIPPGLRERLFAPWARLDRELERRGRQGRGMALAFCSQAVQAQGGRLRVEDTTTGCCFCLELGGGGAAAVLSESCPNRGEQQECLPPAAAPPAAGK